MIANIHKHPIDESYFEEINTKTKSYFLGLLYADGSINDRNRVVINLQERDYEILEKLKIDIQYGGNLYFVKKQFPRQNQKSLQFNNKKIASDLRRLGLNKNKTFFLEFPVFLKEEFKIDFVRGFFDGDGWISKTKNFSVSLGFICLDNFAIEMQKYFNSLNIHSTINYYKKGTYSIENLVCIRVNRKNDIFNLMTKFYENTNVYINRKYEVFKDCFLEKKLHLKENCINSKNWHKKGKIKIPVFKLNVNNFIIEEYDSMKIAAKKNNTTERSIAYNCKKYKNESLNKQNLKNIYCKKENYIKDYKILENLKTSLIEKRIIIQMDLKENFIKEWCSTNETKKEGFDPSAVVKCCKNKLKTHKNFKWEYKN